MICFHPSASSYYRANVNLPTVAIRDQFELEKARKTSAERTEVHQNIFQMNTRGLMNAIVQCQDFGQFDNLSQVAPRPTDENRTEANCFRCFEAKHYCLVIANL